jgi:asparaginyl-tRNA synthetase
MLIKEILAEEQTGLSVTVCGWVRSKRVLKNMVFLEVNDGSCLENVQCVLEEVPLAITTGASVKVCGTLAASVGAKQKVEVAAAAVELLGEADADAYPLQKKAHSFDFLREISHLRARTNTFGAVFRVRSRLAFAVHSFFQNNGFFHINTPLITASDAEGAGAMFQVTTLDLDALCKKNSPPDYSKDFFGKLTSLSVSGQLEAETLALGLGRVYTFGPTFRAENSNTARHLSEFWMIEPEASFFDLNDNMALAESFCKYIISDILTNCKADLEFFDARIEKGIIQNLENIISKEFVHITYTDAVKELEKNKSIFEFEPSWGRDLQSEHEKYLTEKVFSSPVIVTDYPKEIKSFYMKVNADNKTVRAMDVLFPRLGEIIGGSQREENLPVLQARMRDLGMDEKNYWWYLELRKFGSVPHSGFGMGFERIVQYVTGMANIRDVIPFPRAPGLAEF